MNEAVEYCLGCVKFNKKEGECSAFKDLYPLWGEGECWAREESASAWLQRLNEMEAYRESIVGRAVNKKMAKEIKEMKELAKSQSTQDIMEVYYEDLKRGQPGGGGEKADRTNKTFGPNEMKDNRFMHRKRNPSKYRNM